MSRNRLSNKCDCGYELQLSDCVTRPLSIDEYFKAIDHWKGSKYEDEYWDLIIAKAICPHCGRQYAIWLNPKTSSQLDTSFWHSFDDEPCEMCRNLYDKKEE